MNSRVEDYSLVYGGKCFGIVRFHFLDKINIKLIISSNNKEFTSFVIQKIEKGTTKGSSSIYELVPNTGQIPNWFIDFHSISEIQNHLNKADI